MTEPWFYQPHLPEAGASLTLSGREARHALGARRLQTGDHLTLFDGRGGVAHALVASAEGRQREVLLEVQSTESRPLIRPQLHLACALPKGDRQSTLLSMAAQLGLASFTPLRCERAVVKPAASFAVRAERWLIEACKQCRSAHLPTLHGPAGLSAWLERWADATGSKRLLVAHPGGAGLGRALGKVLGPRHAWPEHVAVMIGPEGGFTEAEVAEAEGAEAHRITLGETILRIETAAVAVLGAVRLWSEEAPGAGVPSDTSG